MKAEFLTPKSNGKNDDSQTIFNALAWYALEEVALAYSDLIEA
jgi:hypothetical protein